MTDLDGDFSPEMLSDIAAIFSSGNEVGAISADVPTALKVRKRSRKRPLWIGYIYFWFKKPIHLKKIQNLAIALVEDGVTAAQLEDEKEGLELIKVSGLIIHFFIEKCVKNALLKDASEFFDAFMKHTWSQNVFRAERIHRLTTRDSWVCTAIEDPENWIISPRLGVIILNYSCILSRCALNLSRWPFETHSFEIM